ncbi:MAG: dTDP-4-dehydrorhamnose 3,5-epimerase [Bacteroidales bacterium]|nr:dTDP-4-dehydrorhamnose 3,5-epimerase [Bacteroidales bacterium]
MEAKETVIKGVFVIQPKVYGDARGYFFESWSQRDFDQAIGHHVEFCQDNESLSHRGVLRGLHFQKPPHAQSKLVRCVMGKVLDVAVDIRKGSPTYGQHVAALLTGENHCQFFIPKGFAHGFSVLSDTALFQYKCDEFYHPESEGAIAWDDAQLAIDWQLTQEEILLSEKDMQHPAFSNFESPFTLE